MQIGVLHDARPDCAPHCLEWIAAEGQIVRGTASVLARVVRKLGRRRLPVFVDSIGGSVEDAMAMGRLIRARHLDVVITRSVAPCPTEKECTHTIHEEGGGATAEGRGAVCASACVFVLAAGARRSAAPWALVGVHQLVTKGTRIWKQKVFRVLTRRIGGVKVIVDRELIRERQISSEHFTEKASQATYSRVRAYFSEMGVGASLMPLILATPHEGIHWLTEDEQRSSALVTDLSDGPSLEDEASRTITAGGRRSGLLAASLPEEAVMVVQGSDPTHAATGRGRVVWDLVQTVGSSPDAAPPVLKASVEFARDKIQLAFAPEPNPDHHRDSTIDVDVHFDLGAGSVRKIERLSPLATRKNNAPASPLNGSMRATGAMSFRMVLDAKPSSPNRKMLTDSRWIVMPVVVDGLRFVDISIEIDASANPVLKKAFATWDATLGVEPIAGEVARAPH